MICSIFTNSYLNFIQTGKDGCAIIALYPRRGSTERRNLQERMTIMKKHISKILAALLLATTLIPHLAACSRGGTGKVAQTSDTTPSVATAESTAAATEETTTAPLSLFEQLPKTDYQGRKFTILLPSQQSYEFAETLTGDLVNDAVYTRDSTIEEAYGIDLNYIAESGDWSNRNSFLTLIRNSVLAEDGAYDLVNGMTSIIMPVTMEGIFHNYAAMDGIDFDAPWWAADIYDNLQIADKLYAITGSSMLSMYKTTYVIYANTALIEEYQLDDPIRLVLDGKWTLENYLKMTVGKSRDLNSDGTMTADDFYGFISSAVTMRGYHTAFDLQLIERNNDGTLSYLGGSERYFSAVDRINELLGNANDYYINSITDVSPLVNMFTSERAILFNETIGTVESLRDMTSDFVMLPQPKYDELQENYRVQMGTATGMFVIPITADTDIAVDVLNAHGALSYTDVVPAYYENALKLKYTRIPENMEVIDLINRSIMLDITYAHNYTINQNLTEMFTKHTYGGTDAASTLSAIAKPLEKVLANIYKKYAALE